MTKVTTGNLVLHTWNVSFLQGFIENPQQFAQDVRFQLADGCPNEDERNDFFPFVLQKLQEGHDGHWYGGFIVHESDRTIIGFAGFLGPPDEKGTVEIGYGISPAYQGHGFATEISQGLIDWAFEFPEVTAVTASCRVDNEPSKRVLEKLGMKRTNTREEMVDWTLVRK